MRKADWADSTDHEGFAIEEPALALNSRMTRAIQACRQRIDDAFMQFHGDAQAGSVLALRELSSLPGPDGHLPFADGAVDWVGCFELIEHISSHERQVRLLRELLRVASKGIFVSTANRWHPLDLENGGWPILHLLHERPNLSLLDAAQIKSLIAVLPGKPDWQLGHVRLAGFKSHYFLMIRKPQKTQAKLVTDPGMPP